MGNELADQLAKSAVEDFTLSQTFLPIPHSALKSELKRQLLVRFQQRCSIEQVGQYMHDFILEVSQNFFISNRYLSLFFD